ncbi:uncharacterized protein LOC119719753 [Patiria miniata]|uniref:Endonuclease/exonuclease/phosphatase domain-containing protein n=1 Tax=Patiria miniata TaxID=46514 RepID=A0A913Z0I3_PATMI|nr:uncharacterized protein LOC119719753 [Patiria miniata]
MAPRNCLTAVATPGILTSAGKLNYMSDPVWWTPAEHLQVHRSEDPDIRISSLGSSTIFTSSATRNRQGAAVGGVAITVQTSLRPLLTSISKINDRIMLAVFKGNPKTYVVSCYSPTNTSDEASITGFYKCLNGTFASIPLHALLVIRGDFNAHVARQFFYHSTTNRNGQLLSDFVNRNNLLITNTLFQKSSIKLWIRCSPTSTCHRLTSSCAVNVGETAS